MNLSELKESCNANYRKCILLLEAGESLNSVHDLLLTISEQLLRVGQLSPKDKEVAYKRAVKVFNIARNIKKESSFDDIYYALLGRHLPSEEKVVKEEPEPVEEVKEVKPELVQPIEETNGVNASPVEEIKNPLRPLRLSDYIGQDDVKVQLNNAIKAAKLRGAPLKHVILFGNAGLGKTTLSRIIANEMNSGFIEMNGPSIRDVQSFVNIFSKVREGDVVFIDEIHRLPTVCAEAIYSAMEDYRISYMAKNSETGISENITLNLPRFTLIGATTHSGMLAKPLLDRFVHQYHLKPYTDEDICKIVEHSFSKLNLECPTMCAMEIAKRSRGIPRKANAFVEQFSDKALLEGTSIIDIEMISTLFDQLKINEDGLDSFDMDYLETMNDKYGGGPIGLDTLCSCLSIDKNIVENQIEPYLLFKGLIKISSTGRELTPSGVTYINKNKKLANMDSEKNYFASLLEDHQYEKLIINLCSKLEAIFQEKMLLTGTFQEMMESYTNANCDEHITELLNKLRMKRNDLVHPSERDIDLSDSDIIECIEYICGLEG